MTFIKGIEIGVDQDEIKLDLEKNGFNVNTVTEMRNRFKQPQPLYRVELEPTSTKLKSGEVHPIYKLKYSLNRVITVEEPRKRTGPVQCMNCKEYSHTRGYCTLAPICVIWAEPHPTQDCPKPKGEIYRKCKNCTGNHTANYRGCPVYIALRNKMIKNKVNSAPKITIQNQPPNQPTALVYETATYRDALVNPPQPSAQNNISTTTSIEQMFQTPSKHLCKR